MKAVCYQTAWKICAGVEALRGKLAGIPRDLQVLVEGAVISTCLEILGLPIGELVGASRDPQVLWKAFCHQSGVRLHSCGKLKVSLGISSENDLAGELPDIGNNRIHRDILNKTQGRNSFNNLQKQQDSLLTAFKNHKQSI